MPTKKLQRARRTQSVHHAAGHATRKKSPAQLQREIKAALAQPPRSKSAAVLVYSKPSGYWYAQAHDPTTGKRITDASDYSREGVLRELQGKFPMIGVRIESITDEDPYQGAHATKRSDRQTLAPKESWFRRGSGHDVTAEDLSPMQRTLIRALRRAREYHGPLSVTASSEGVARQLAELGLLHIEPRDDLGLTWVTFTDLGRNVASAGNLWR